MKFSEIIKKPKKQYNVFKMEMMNGITRKYPLSIELHNDILSFAGNMPYMPVLDITKVLDKNRVKYSVIGIKNINEFKRELQIRLFYD